MQIRIPLQRNAVKRTQCYSVRQKSVDWRCNCSSKACNVLKLRLAFLPRLVNEKRTFYSDFRFFVTAWKWIYSGRYLARDKFGSSVSAVFTTHLKRPVNAVQIVWKWIGPFRSFLKRLTGPVNARYWPLDTFGFIVSSLFQMEIQTHLHGTQKRRRSRAWARSSNDGRAFFGNAIWGAFSVSTHLFWRSSTRTFCQIFENAVIMRF